MSRPELSVIVPTRNRAQRLRGAVDAVLAQSLRDLEVVVVDDGSTDATPDVTTELAAGDPRVRVLRHEKSVGAAAARNAGLDAARGELVGFCDDDDRWLPHKAARQVAALRAAPAAAGVSCWATIEDESSGGRATLRTPTSVTFDDLLWFNFPGSFTYGVVRNDGRRLDPAMPSCQDWDFWLRCAEGGPFVTVPEVLAVFTVHDGPRITSPASEAAGRRRLVDRWSGRMSPACLAYHRAHFDLGTGVGTRHRAAVLRRLVAQRSVRAAAIVLTEVAACKLGARAGDPALNSRVLHRMLRNPAVPA